MDEISKWESIWIPVFKTFEHTHPEDAARMVDWYPSGQMEITIKLDNGHKIVYDWINNRKIYVCRDGVNNVVNDETIKKNFSNRLRKKLFVTGMSQDQLAYESGISYVTISKYLHGKAAPSLTNASRLARVLNCSLNELIYDSDF